MITVQAGDLFNVDFRATPATGYQWSAAGVPAGIELLEDSFAPDPTASGPAPVPPTGTHRFHFLAGGPGRMEIVFVLQRVWESEPLQQHVEVVEIKP